jgi:hypothetical protein
VGDLPELAAALAPRPLRLSGLVDGLDRAVPVPQLETTLATVRAAYHSHAAESRLRLEDGAHVTETAASWILRQIRPDGKGSGDSSLTNFPD